MKYVIIGLGSITICGIILSALVLLDGGENNALPTRVSLQQESGLVVIPSFTPLPATATSTPIPPTATITNTPTLIPPTATATPVPRTSTPLPPTITPTPLPPIVYSSQSLGLQPVIGPMNLPAGIYRVTATTRGFIIADFDVTRGNCEIDGFGSLFNLSQGQANSGAQRLIVSEGCEAIITVSNTRENWTLEFQQLGSWSISDYQQSYTSQALGLQPVIGPIRDGRYRVTVTTSGFIIADLVPVQGTCEHNNFGSMFNLGEGQASSGAQRVLNTQSCVAFITITNTREPWTISFDPL